MIRQIWATNPHSAHPPSSWLSLMITKGSVNLPRAAWESPWHRWDLSSPQRSSAAFLSSGRDEEQQSERLKPHRWEFAWRPGRAGQWFLGKREPVNFYITLENIQPPKSSFGSTLQSASAVWRTLGAVRAAWHPCRNLPLHPQGKEIAWRQLGSAKGREYSPGTEIKPFLLTLSKPCLSAGSRANYSSSPVVVPVPVPCACHSSALLLQLPAEGEIPVESPH